MQVGDSLSPAATNFPESLDKALVRPGRFDRHVAVPLPDVRGRMEILKHHMRNIVHDKAAVDISIIARGTIGFSGADLQALVNQAAVKASADRAEAVRPSHFEWAKERVRFSPLLDRPSFLPLVLSTSHPRSADTYLSNRS